ncbi:MAG: Uncharacterized protein XD63_0405 [Thermoanaerobacterales bacterium 50_218]|nr:MAG: Uncharacterized protein XD63_0405 [Thermoanaerobacterales bacterium 50_218]HAA89692.1 hypothetical protein [Peptococcaceae bacterium]
MTLQVVAVEEGLSQISRALRDAGYEVTKLKPEELKKARAIVVSGIDTDVLQFQDVTTEAPVISAEGRTAEEVVEEVKRRIR